MLVNAVEIIFSLCEYLYHGPTSGISGVSNGSLKLLAVNWEAIGHPMHGLAISGWLEATGVPSFTKTISIPSISGSNSRG